jgi:imidazolonepropionase-like amidohydrolase
MQLSRSLSRVARTLSLAALVAGGVGTAWAAEGEGRALCASKILTCSADASSSDDSGVIDNGVLLIKDGLIEAVLTDAADIPSGYVIENFGDAWLMPGLVDLHSHIAGSGFNGRVYQANPGLRVKATVVPRNENLVRALAAGVTTILYIPGSATTVGGQGVLLKTSPANYEPMVVRDPGSLKVAQADNPKRWGYGMNRIFLNWTIRDIFQRGADYSAAWDAFEAGTGPEPERLIQLDIFRDLFAHRTQISAHTQVHQVILASMEIMKEKFGLDLYIDHGTFDGYKAAEIAESLGVPAVIGPRSVNSQNKNRGIDTDGAIIGVAAEYQRRGLSRIGFNTDAPVVPQEELALQSAMGVRYGFDDSTQGAIRGLTIVPAGIAGIDHRLGSLEVGKDADVLVITGHPSDPRTSVERVFVNGELVYNAEVRRVF